MAKQIVHSRVDNDVYQALRVLAAERERTVSAVIAKILKTAVTPAATRSTK